MKGNDMENCNQTMVLSSTSHELLHNVALRIEELEKTCSIRADEILKYKRELAWRGEEIDRITTLTDSLAEENVKLVVEIGEHNGLVMKLRRDIDILEKRPPAKASEIQELGERIEGRDKEIQRLRGVGVELRDKIEILEQSVEHWSEYANGLEALLEKWQAERGAFLTEQELLKAQVRNRDKSLADLRSEREFQASVIGELQEDINALQRLVCEKNKPVDTGVRVPAEPTIGMVSAGMGELGKPCTWRGDRVLRIYKAMIAAAQETQTEPA